MTQTSGQNAQALFSHLHDGAGLNTISSQPLVDDTDANGSDTYVYASDHEIAKTDADAGPALRTPPMYETQFFIIRFMELLTGRNAFAINFQANPIAQAQIRDYKVRTLHAPDVTRHAKVPPHQVLNNAANSRVDGYIQNLQFQILMLYKLTILLIQHVLEWNTKMTLIDLVSMCAALLRFAERSAYILIRMKEGAQGAQQFDPDQDKVMSHAIHPFLALRLIQGQGSQDLVNPQAGQYSATMVGLGQQIPPLVTFTPTQIVQQFYSGQLIPKPQIQQPFQGFGMYPGIQQFQGFPKPSFFQQTQPSSSYSIQLQRQPCITQGLPQFMQSSPTFGLQQTQLSNLLTLPAPSSAVLPTFQFNFQSQNSEQLNQEYNQLPTIRQPTLAQQQSRVQESRYVYGRLIDSPGTALTRKISQDQQPFRNSKRTQRTDQSLQLQQTPKVNDKHELTTVQCAQRFLSIKKLHIKIHMAKIQWVTPQRIWRRSPECECFHLETCQT
ncbi:MAG: hypothetical protein EZS28_005449 [Streblomastix strix]|uniref:Uncharacterized protein n=1 Tax=Streblomastix strix TaxID=222440 RepID=A0A5J4WWY6_9EUKA|nr:MAG: hypothetical protein EZS28_005449 [Streblomastix strix]